MDENEVKSSENITEDNSGSSILSNIENNEQNPAQDETVNQEEPTVANQAAQTQESKYSIQDFIDNSKALGYKKEVVAGALFNCKETELTKAAFEEKIKKFLGKRVE